MNRSLVMLAAGLVSAGLLSPGASGSAPKLLVLEDFVDYVG